MTKHTRAETIIFTHLYHLGSIKKKQTLKRDGIWTYSMACHIASTALNSPIPAPDSSCTSEIVFITTEILGNEVHPVVNQKCLNRLGVSFL